MIAKSRRRSVAAGSAALGGMAGVWLVWLARAQPRPPGSVLLDSGYRSPMPVIVVGPPPWAYALAVILGALIGAGIALAAFHVAGRGER